MDHRHFAVGGMGMPSYAFPLPYRPQPQQQLPRPSPLPLPPPLPPPPPPRPSPPEEDQEGMEGEDVEDYDEEEEEDYEEEEDEGEGMEPSDFRYPPPQQQQQQQQQLLQHRPNGPVPFARAPYQYVNNRAYAQQQQLARGARYDQHPNHEEDDEEFEEEGDGHHHDESDQDEADDHVRRPATRGQMNGRARGLAHGNGAGAGTSAAAIGAGGGVGVAKRTKGQPDECAEADLAINRVYDEGAKNIIFDSCEEIRNRVKRYLERTKEGFEALLRHLKDKFPDVDVRLEDLQDFMREHGPMGGLDNICYWCLYWFFEAIYNGEIESAFKPLRNQRRKLLEDVYKSMQMVARKEKTKEQYEHELKHDCIAEDKWLKGAKAPKRKELPGGEGAAAKKAKVPMQQPTINQYFHPDR